MADISGISRIRSWISTELRAGVKKNANAAPDRDADGKSGQGQQEKKHQLSQEQEEAALKKLLTMHKFNELGLSARIIREEGGVVHIEVTDSSGNVVHRLPYDQIVKIFLEGNTEQTTGVLLKRTA